MDFERGWLQKGQPRNPCMWQSMAMARICDECWPEPKLALASWQRIGLENFREFLEMEHILNSIPYTVHVWKEVPH